MHLSLSIIAVLSFVLEALAVSSSVSFPILPRGAKPPSRRGLSYSDAVRRGFKPRRRIRPRATSCDVISPKLFIFSMFDSEAEVWYEDTDLNLYANNITVDGFSHLFPDAHCTAAGDICQLTTGEGEINAAATITALIYSPCFDLKSTYFLIAGIAGINPHLGTTGSVTFARYAVQFDLQYEFLQSQVPSNDSSGYFFQGAEYPDSPDPIDYPGEIYGTEAFELNVNLRDKAFYLASLANLNDTDGAAAYRIKYGYAPANKPPSVVKCDSGTSNNYFSGSVLGDAFTNYTLLLTNGTGVYCATQQEDNATPEALLRGQLASKVDFSRIVITGTASDFDRAPPGVDEVYHLLFADQEGFLPSIENIYLAGIEIVKDIRMYWEDTWKAGIEPDNYVGDLFDTLAGMVAPDIGTEEIYIN